MDIPKTGINAMSGQELDQLRLRLYRQGKSISEAEEMIAKMREYDANEAAQQYAQNLKSQSKYEEWKQGADDAAAFNQRSDQWETGDGCMRAPTPKGWRDLGNGVLEIDNKQFPRTGAPEPMPDNPAFGKPAKMPQNPAFDDNINPKMPHK